MRFLYHLVDDGHPIGRWVHVCKLDPTSFPLFLSLFTLAGNISLPLPKALSLSPSFCLVEYSNFLGPVSGFFPFYWKSLSIVFLSFFVYGLQHLFPFSSEAARSSVVSFVMIYFFFLCVRVNMWAAFLSLSLSPKTIAAFVLFTFHPIVCLSLFHRIRVVFSDSWNRVRVTFISYSFFLMNPNGKIRRHYILKNHDNLRFLIANNDEIASHTRVVLAGHDQTKISKCL